MTILILNSKKNKNSQTDIDKRQKSFDGKANVVKDEIGKELADIKKGLGDLGKKQTELNGLIEKPGTTPEENENVTKELEDLEKKGTQPVGNEDHNGKYQKVADDHTPGSPDMGDSDATKERAKTNAGQKLKKIRENKKKQFEDELTEATNVYNTRNNLLKQNSEAWKDPTELQCQKAEVGGKKERTRSSTR